MALCFLLSTANLAVAGWTPVHYYTQESALDALFPKADHINTEDHQFSPAEKTQIEARLGWHVPESKVQIIKAYEDSEFLGYAIILDEIGKHDPITFITAVTPEYKVADVRVMVYREPFGDEVRKKRFLRQFFKKSAQDPIMIHRDIDGISGATFSTAALASGVKKALIIVETVSLPQFSQR